MADGMMGGIPIDDTSGSLVKIDQGYFPLGANVSEVVFPEQPAQMDMTMGGEPHRSALAIFRLTPGALVNGDRQYTLAAAYTRNLFNVSRNQTGTTVAGGSEYGTMNTQLMMTVSTTQNNTAGMVPAGQSFLATGLRAFKGEIWTVPTGTANVFGAGVINHASWLRNDTFGESVNSFAARAIAQAGWLRWDWQVTDTRCQKVLTAFQDILVPDVVSPMAAPIYQLRRDFITGAEHPNGMQLVIEFPNAVVIGIPDSLVPSPNPDIIVAIRVQVLGYSVCGVLPTESQACPTNLPIRGTNNNQAVSIVAFNDFQRDQARRMDQLANTVGQLANVVRGLKG